MQGLEIAEQFYNDYGKQLIADKFGTYKDRVAAGLVGDGSECYGFDDEISRDHDWGAGFCLWLSKSDYDKIGDDMDVALRVLERDAPGFPGRIESDVVKAANAKRTGAFETNWFYWNFIGLTKPPDDWREWLRIPEANLAACTNGKVFDDPLGEFSAYREKLIAFFPEDVKLKKIASKCMSAAQSGQYNYSRCISREEFVAANHAEAKFCTDILSIVFLLNKRYKPFYKWMHRAVKSLPVMGEKTYNTLNQIALSSDHKTKQLLIEMLCEDVIAVFKEQGLSNIDSSFLLDHGPEIQKRISIAELKERSVWLD